MIGSHWFARLRRAWRAEVALATAILVLIGSLEQRVAGQLGTGSIELVSVTTTAVPGGGQLFIDALPYDDGGPSKISGDNRYVVFASPSDQLVPGDTNSRQDIFVRDRQTSITTLVSQALGGGPANDHSNTPVISANGRYVVFASLATNLVASDSNGAADIFVRDLQMGITTRVSVSSLGGQANAASFDPVINADGRYIAFVSSADNLVPGDTNLFNSDIFLRDTLAGTTTRVSLRSDGTEIVRADSLSPSISADGRKIAFGVYDSPNAGPPPASAGPNLHEGIYVRDLDTGATTLASVRPDGSPASLLVALHPMISANGQFVTFVHWEDLDPNFPDSQDESDGPYSDVFVRDLQAGVTDRVSLPFPGGPVEESGGRPSISGNGRYVAYLANDGVRVRDRVAGTTTMVAPTGVVPDSNSDSPSISEDGQLVYFESYATNLVPNDTNGVIDTFVFRMAPSADLSLALSADTLQPAVNGNVTLTVGVTNGGFAETTAVAVRAPLPVGLTFVSATPGAGSYSSATGIWTVGTLATGTTSTLQIIAQFTATSSVSVTAQVSASSLPDPDSTPDNSVATEDDQRSVVLTPGIADLSLMLTANTTTPTVNSNVTLTAALTNSGPGSGTGVEVNMALPGNLTFVSATTSAGSYDSATRTWTLPTIANGATRTLQVVARVASTSPADVVAQVGAANQLDPDSTPNNNNPGEDDQAAIRLTPAASAGIIVNDATPAVNPNDGKCTLIEAITAANTDAPSGNALGECVGGSGADVIRLRALTPPYTLVAVHNTLYGANGLPLITSDITIDGGGATVERSLVSTVPAFRLFAVDTTGRLVLDHTVVRNGRAFTAGVNFGGAIANFGTLELDRSVISNNIATCDGGGIFSNGPLALRNGTIIETNTSNFCSGGGVSAYYAGTVTVADTTFRGNATPAASGGGFYLHGTNTATMTASQVVTNTARLEGGGVFTHGPDANLSIANTTISGNVVTLGSGGGIANGRLDMPSGTPLILGGTMTLTNVSVVGNRVTGGYGAGISTVSPLTVTASGITDNQITLGSSGCGGGLYNAGSSTIVGTNIARNQGPNSPGGGLCAIGFGPLVVSESTIASNTASVGGGVALYFSPSATFANSTIVSNSGSGMGGGLYSVAGLPTQTVALDNTVVQQNSTLGAGGGLHFQGGTITLRNNTRILSNTAGTAGGGILLNYGGPCCSTVTMTGGTIDGNIANGAWATHGGGGGLANLDVNPSSAVTLTDVLFASNRAPIGDGGGVFNRGALTMTRGALQNNHAQGGGGLANGTSTMTGGPTTLNDVLIEGNVASNPGGGVFTANPVGGPSSTVTINGGTIRNNRAIEGGGIQVRENGTVEVSSAVLIANNVASAIGGGIHNLGTLRVHTATISGNSANFGGGIYSSGASTVTATTLNGNTATTGAAFYIAKALTEITNSTISGNTASGSGASAMQIVGTALPDGTRSARVNLVYNTITNNVGGTGGINSQGGYVFIVANILAANRAPDLTVSECRGGGGSSWQHGFNLIGQDGSCALSAAPLEYSIDPASVFTTELGPLADNGGPTRTHALLPGSFAIDAGGTPVSGLGNCSSVDQRGLPRPVNAGTGVSRCDLGSFEAQDSTAMPPPVLASIAPTTVAAGPGAMTLTLTGAGFRTLSTTRWNGAERETVVRSANQLSFTLRPGDLNTGTDLATGLLTVTNPDGTLSNALPLTIVSSTILQVQSQIAAPGTSATASVLANVLARSSISAALTNNDPTSGPATISVATYVGNPIDGLFAAGGFFDVQVKNVDASDSADVRFYYPGTVTGPIESSLQLQYWNGTAWAPVTASGGAAPAKDTTNNLDGTLSGGRFTVMLDHSSTPRLIDLSGTVFALVETTAAGPPVTLATVSPAANAAGWHNTSVFVTVRATAGGSTVARTEYNLDDRGWTTYTMPIPVLTSGIHTLRYRSIASNGAVEDTKTLTVRIDKTAPTLRLRVDPLILWPADGHLRNIDVDATLRDSLSGGDRFTLVAVDSNHHNDAADIVGWTTGTPDTRGQLRARFTGLFNPRIYRLTYKGGDLAGNETIEHVYVFVLQLFGHP